jgi:hypothetical protein
MTASLNGIASKLDCLNARSGLDIGELLLPAFAELGLIGFRRLLKQLHIPPEHATACMRYASDPDARRFIEYGVKRAVILTALPRDARPSFLQSHDVTRLSPDDLAELVGAEPGNSLYTETSAR